jgi:hypothetical protein
MQKKKKKKKKKKCFGFGQGVFLNSKTLGSSKKSDLDFFLKKKAALYKRRSV